MMVINQNYLAIKISHVKIGLIGASGGVVYLFMLGLIGSLVVLWLYAYLK